MPNFRSPGGSFASFGGYPVPVVTPVNLGTHIMSPTDRVVFYNHPTSVANYIIQLPGAVEPGEPVSFKMRSSITSLTVRDAFGTAVFGPGAATTGQVLTFRIIDSVGWILW